MRSEDVALINRRDRPIRFAMALTGVRVLPELTYGELDNCMLTVWHEKPTVHSVTELLADLTTFCGRFPGGAAIVQIVEPRSKPPDETVRKASADGLRKVGPNLKVVGFVFEGDQFRVALNRTVLTTLMFFLKQPYPTKVVRTPRDALELVSTRVAVREDFVPDGVLALEHLRQLRHRTAA